MTRIDPFQTLMIGGQCHSLRNVHLAAKNGNGLQDQVVDLKDLLGFSRAKLLENNDEFCVTYRSLKDPKDNMEKVTLHKGREGFHK